MASRFVPNQRGIKQFGRSAGVEAALLALVDGRVKPRAVALTPVQSGRMKTSWRTGSGVERGVAYARIWNTAKDPRTGYRYPAAVEFGTSRMRAQRVLGRALDALREKG